MSTGELERETTYRILMEILQVSMRLKQIMAEIRNKITATALQSPPPAPQFKTADRLSLCGQCNDVRTALLGALDDANHVAVELGVPPPPEKVE